MDYLGQLVRFAREHAPLGVALTTLAGLAAADVGWRTAGSRATGSSWECLLVVGAVVAGMMASLILAYRGHRRRTMEVAQLFSLGQKLIETPAEMAAFSTPKAGRSLSELARVLEQADSERSVTIAARQRALADMRQKVEPCLERLPQATAALRPAVTSMSSRADEVALSLNRLIERASEAEQFTQSSLTHATLGVEEVVSAGHEIRMIAEVLEQSAFTLQSLSERSQEIGGIAHELSDIADRTKVLSLNAAIEAVRAGLHGRGFSVVAEAVRELAERVTASSREVVAIVKAIQRETNRAVGTMERAQEQVNASLALSQEAGNTLSRIHLGATQSETTVKGIADATRELKGVTARIAQEISSLALGLNQSEESLSSAAAAVRDVLFESGTLEVDRHPPK